MARKALKVSCQKKKNAYLRALSQGRKPKFPTRVYNRCEITGRRHGYLRYFKMSRIVFREMARKGLLPGVTKSSW